MKNVLQCVVICWAEVEGAIQWRTCYNTWWYAAIHGGMLGRSGGLVSMSTCKWKMMSFLFKTHKFAARWNCSNKFFGTKLMPGYLRRHVAFGKSAKKKHTIKHFRVVYKMVVWKDKIFAFTSFLHARTHSPGGRDCVRAVWSADSVWIGMLLSVSRVAMHQPPGRFPLH